MLRPASGASPPADRAAARLIGSHASNVRGSRLALRALDGRLAGETYRAIAQALFGAARVPAGPGWKTHDLRDRTIRLARAGLKLMQGGYLDLLRYPQQRE